MNDTKLHNNLQLAKTVSMYDLVYPCRAELKLDGVRGFLYKNKFYSRQGHEIHLPEITFKLDSSTLNRFVDLEFTLKSGMKKDRSTVSGMINSAMKGGHEKIDQSLLYFNVFDTLSDIEFEHRLDSPNYKGRLIMLDTILDSILRKDIHFLNVPFTDVNNVKELRKYYDYWVNSGYEGVVAKQYTDTYQYKRSKQWARFKPTKTADLHCIGTTKGQGNREGGIGALILTGIVDKKNVVVSVGSGLTFEEVFTDPAYFIGKTIETDYDSVTQNKLTGQYSLYQARNPKVRIDK